MERTGSPLGTGARGDQHSQLIKDKEVNLSTFRSSKCFSLPVGPDRRLAFFAEELMQDTFVSRSSLCVSGVIVAHELRDNQKVPNTETLEIKSSMI